MSTPFMIGSVAPIEIYGWTIRRESEPADEAPVADELLTDRPAA